MSASRLVTAMAGFGQVASGYADDAVMARYFRYAAHAQVLAEHPVFEWAVVVDPRPVAREEASNRWSVPLVVENAALLGAEASRIEVLVLATPPDARIKLLDFFPALRAVLVEKPLGVTLADSNEFLQRCRARGVLVQVNLWRRADELFRTLAQGQLQQLVGAPQCCFGIYGNGLLNNGTHMVDFVRMLLGEIRSTQHIGEAPPFVAGPIPGDINVPFALNLACGASAIFQPIAFEHYRENSLDIWGHTGRLSVCNEGLTASYYPVSDNRAVKDEREIACDAAEQLNITVGTALYRLYTNLADAVGAGVPLWSDGESAFQSSIAVEAIICATRERRLVQVSDVADRLSAALRLS